MCLPGCATIPRRISASSAPPQLRVTDRDAFRRLVDVALDVTSADLVEIMQEEGLEVTSHASSVAQEEADVIRDLLLGGEATLEDLERTMP